MRRCTTLPPLQVCFRIMRYPLQHMLLSTKMANGVGTHWQNICVPGRRVAVNGRVAWALLFLGRSHQCYGCPAGMAFANAFLGVCHSMAHKLGGTHHVPHGLANALLISHVIRYNATGELLDLYPVCHSEHIPTSQSKP